jgi:hypothetical protein
LRAALSLVRISRIAATTEKPSMATAMVSAPNSWRLRSKKTLMKSGSTKAVSAAPAGAIASIAPPRPLTRPADVPRTSDVHDSRVRRIDATTPDMKPPTRTIQRRCSIAVRESR